MQLQIQRVIKFILPKIFLLQLCLVTGIIGSAQKNQSRIPGTVGIDKFSSIDQTEVTIQEYVFFILNNDFNPGLFPDSSTLNSAAKSFFSDLHNPGALRFIKLIQNSSFIKMNYGQWGFKVTQAYKDMLGADTSGFSIFLPMTGVSFEQANLFCKWRETQVNAKRRIKVNISLPPPDVYKKIIENSDSIASKCQVSCPCYLFNYLHAPCSVSSKDEQQQGKGLVRADSYWPTNLDIYCLPGNAAEMTSEKGIAAGGSFKHFARAAYNDQVQPYVKPENWLGFRCYITIYK
jgi:hypothetical protein